MKKRVAWNKGLTKESDIRVAKITDKLKYGWSIGKYKYVGPKDISAWKRNQKKARIKLLKEHPEYFIGTYKRGFVKIYSYKGILLQGTWELRFAMWCDKNNIIWEKNKKSFNYTYKNKSRLYFPDFYLKDIDKYVEIKGYETERDLAKWKQFPKKDDLVVIDALLFKQLGIADVLSLKDCSKFLKNKFDCSRCKICGKVISRKSTYCKKCTPHKRKVKRPTKEVLEKLVKEKPFVYIGKMFGVSDTAVREWCKSYGIVLEKYYYQKNFY